MWTDVVGAAIAAQAEPTAERDGVVTVTCASAVWAQELDLMSSGVADRLNAALGSPLVRGLRCQAVAPRSWASKRPNGRS